ncbi:hypothetical protein OQA88_626 [Cercophora sp. LCS_1]
MNDCASSQLPWIRESQSWKGDENTKNELANSFLWKLNVWVEGREVAVVPAFLRKAGAQKQRSMDGIVRSLLYPILNTHRELIPEAFPQHWSPSSWSPWTPAEDMEIRLESDEIQSAFEAIIGHRSSGPIRSSLTRHDNFLRFPSSAGEAFIESFAQASSDGVFIWTKLVLSELLNKLDDDQPLEDLYDVLEILPKDLDEFYEKILSSIRSADSAESWAILDMLMVARAE